MTGRVEGAYIDERQHAELSELMRLNQERLRELGVSHPAPEWISVQTWDNITNITRAGEGVAASASARMTFR